MITNWLLHHHGFLLSRSVCTNLLSCMFQWVDALDKRNSVDVICLDIAKAFDTVSHQKLIHKLEHLSLSSTFVNWIKDFLKDRTHKVKVGSTLSSTSPQWCESRHRFRPYLVLNTLVTIDTHATSTRQKKSALHLKLHSFYAA